MLLFYKQEQIIYLFMLDTYKSKFDIRVLISIEGYKYFSYKWKVSFVGTGLEIYQRLLVFFQDDISTNEYYSAGKLR